MKPWRAEVVALVAALYIGTVLNVAFWKKVLGTVAPQHISDWAFVASALLAVVGIYFLVLIAFSVKPLLRVLLAVVLPLTAAASYFMNEYGIVIDGNMVRNVFETDARETGDLITLKMVMWIVALGVVPAALLCFVPWSEQTLREEAWRKTKIALPVAVVIAAAVYPFFGNYLSLVREHKELKQTLTPFNYVSALVNFLGKTEITHSHSIAAYGEDAHRLTGTASSTRKRLFIVAVGETARWDHFSLNGYARATNPELSKVADLVNFPNAFSCGTDTAQSVPCMFSGLGKAGFTNEKAAARENLLDILKRAGIDVLWRENQAGCKGVCDRVSNETLTGLKHPTFYVNSENFDEILIDDLDQRIAKLDRDAVIVLHMMGSHGPAYWKRYPEKFEVFKPACHEAQFSRCTNPEIVAAYDNTILYTDYVLAKLIGKLSRAAEHGVDAGLIYMSDHGESLGEGNIYLHGMPYAFAPEGQIHIPAVAWLSPSLRETLGVDQACLAKHTSARVSHDNLFHSVLGVMNVATHVYEPSLDLFAACRPPKVVTSGQ